MYLSCFMRNPRYAKNLALTTKNIVEMCAAGGRGYGRGISPRDEK
jgi:hypothetical protein